MRTLIARINRKLAHDLMRLRTLRGERWVNDLGRHYIVDCRSNTIEQCDVDPEEWAREEGILRPYEKVIE